jgi:hypothetical protein
MVWDGLAWSVFDPWLEDYEYDPEEYYVYDLENDWLDCDGSTSACTQKSLKRAVRKLGTKK